MKRRLDVRRVLLAMGIIMALPWVMTFGILLSAARMYELRLRGNWIPLLWPPGAYRVAGLAVESDRYGRIGSGEAVVSINYLSFLLLRGRVAVAGKDLTVELSSKFAQPDSPEKFPVKAVDAEVEFPLGGDPVVRRFRIDSPAVQFRLEESGGRGGGA
jgi:hypothetical protein